MSPSTHRQILLDTAQEYHWTLRVLPKNFRFYDLILVKGDIELRFRFDKRDRISAASQVQRGEGVWQFQTYPNTKKLDYAIEVLRGPKVTSYLQKER